MHTPTEPHAPDEPVGAGSGYEPRDASTRPVVVTGFFLFMLMLFGFAGGAFFYTSFTELEEAARPRPSPVYQRDIPGGARLQSDPEVERENYVAAQRDFLDSYGWVDHDRGVVHVPVERAMNRVLADGSLPRWLPPEPVVEREEPAEATSEDGAAARVPVVPVEDPVEDDGAR